MIVNSGVETGKKLSRSTLAFKSQNRFKFCDPFLIPSPSKTGNSCRIYRQDCRCQLAFEIKKEISIIDRRSDKPFLLTPMGLGKFIPRKSQIPLTQ
jgi:hypothetical protein